jgi:hypothetical protein
VFERRKLNESERLYSIYDKEMLAIMHALTKFRQYLVGSRFVVKIDHNSLKYFVYHKVFLELQGSDLQSDSYQEVPKDQGAQFGTVSRRICRL